MKLNSFLLLIFLLSITLSSCDEMGLVEKEKYQRLERELSQVQSDLESSQSEIRRLKIENEELRDKLSDVEDEAYYQNFLRLPIPTHKVNVINEISEENVPIKKTVHQQKKMRLR